MSETFDFEAFYERHWKYVYRLCFTYMRNAEEAEDCTEDVFVKVLNGEFTFEDEVHERKWLTVTAINYCKDKLKSWKHKAVDYLDDVPEPAAEESDDHSEVLEAVKRLPVKYKEVIWLYYYDGYQTDEIAKMLRSPPSTVRNRLRDARKLLKNILGEIRMNGNDKIERAIESIEPRGGAKERMLANIKRKAAEQNRETSETKKKAPSFAEIAKWALPIAACLVIAVVGIKVIPQLAAPDEPSDVLVGSPFVTVDSADEFEKQLGITIDAPEGASGIEYAIIDGNIAEVYFSYDEKTYSLRASGQSGDFSGLYGVEAAAEQLDSANNAVLATIRSGDQTFLKLTWTDGKVNYILSDTDGGNEDEIKKIYGLVK